MPPAGTVDRPVGGNPAQWADGAEWQMRSIGTTSPIGSQPGAGEARAARWKVKILLAREGCSWVGSVLLLPGSSLSSGLDCIVTREVRPAHPASRRYTHAMPIAHGGRSRDVTVGWRLQDVPIDAV